MMVDAVPDLYRDPVQYGINDVTIPGVGPARIIFPAAGGNIFTAPVRPGTYPLVVFVHGDRSAESWLCPPDITHDYRRWMRILHLLAECGFVVVAPDVHAMVYSGDDTADAIEETVRWMHFHWQDRDVLWLPGEFLDPDHIAAQSIGEDREAS